jgi:hypothetical protein
VGPAVLLAADHADLDLEERVRFHRRLQQSSCDAQILVETDDAVAVRFGEPPQRRIEGLRTGHVDRRIREPALLGAIERRNVVVGGCYRHDRKSYR